MKRHIILLGVLALVTAAVVSTSAPARTHQSVTLRMMMITSNQVPMDLMIKNFQNAYPNIKVDVTYVPFTTFAASLLPQLQAGSAPDLTYVTGGGQDLMSVYALGPRGKDVLLPLNGSPWWPRVLKPLRPLMTVGPSFYAMPLAVNPLGFYYHKDVFRKFGLQPPKTFSQLVTLCEKLNAAGTVPIAYNTGWPTGWTHAGLQAFVYSKDPTWSLKRSQHKVTASESPLWKQWIGAMVQLRDAKCFQPGAASTPQATAYAMFAQSQMAMLGMEGGAAYGSLKAINPNGVNDLDFFPLPGDTAANTKAVYTAATNIAALKIGSHTKEAKAFITFVGRPKQAALYASAAGALSLVDAAKANLPNWLAGLRPYFKAGNATPPPTNRFPKITILPAIQQTLPGMLTGQRTPEDVLKAVDAAWG